jgi:hypothetical protein
VFEWFFKMSLDSNVFDDKEFLREERCWIH